MGTDSGKGIIWLPLFESIGSEEDSGKRQRTAKRTLICRLPPSAIAIPMLVGTIP